MAHVHAFGDVAPAARDIIHLGATSCYVTDNTDLILMQEALRRPVRQARVASSTPSATFARPGGPSRRSASPTSSRPSSPPSASGACLWCHDFVLDLEEIEHRRDGLRFRGVKGTTGTQASFLALFHGDHDKVRRLDGSSRRRMGFDDVYPVTGQTYTRKVDSQVLDALAGLGQSRHKLGTDLRLLAHGRRSRSRSRRTRSAPRRWRTSATRCAPSGCAAWPGS